MKVDSFLSRDNIEFLVKQVVPQISIVCQNGLPNGTHCKWNGKRPILFWDPLTFEYFNETLFLMDVFTTDDDIEEEDFEAIQNQYYGILFNHLSKRYADFPWVHDILQQVPDLLLYKSFKKLYEEVGSESEMGIQYHMGRVVVHYMMLLHESAHAFFKLNCEEKEKYEDFVVRRLEWYNSFDNKEEYFNLYSKHQKKDVKKQFYGLLKKDSDYRVQLEEIAADTFALRSVYSALHSNMSWEDKEKLSDCIMLGYLRYVGLTSDYMLILEHWNELYSRCVIRKKRKQAEIDSFLYKRGVFNSIRIGIWPLLMLKYVLELDADTWNYNAKNGFSMKDPRIEALGKTVSKTRRKFLSIFSETFSAEIFNRIVKNANKLKVETSI